MCWFCGLTTGASGTFSFHRGPKVGGCSSGMSDNVEQYCWYLYRNRMTLLDPFLSGRSLDEKDFQAWLSKKHNEFCTNMWVVFTKTLKLL
jgi:hypothetical protein